LTIGDRTLRADFDGTAPAVRGNINAVPAIVRSAVIYCLRCVALALLEREIPMNEGLFTPIELEVPPGSLLDPPPGRAVAAGNVETSQRIVDVVMGALAQALPEYVPAASQGTMNNVTFGGDLEGHTFAYYETLGGGIGAGPQGPGGSGMHAHMSNTRNTPVEALESTFPLRVEKYALRTGSGGCGRHAGGDGLVRRIRFLAPVSVTITSERRQRRPYGLCGGDPGKAGRNAVTHVDGRETVVGGKVSLQVEAGDVVTIETPGGGAWGEA
ncbi:MAG TPA: hydantoinase B/oxoprolinase family protein, partial [Candidatus Binatia bacterium]|nr:hydantoinase B/oxoprolinase family protein [Candidatus Binatia bacterium]